MKFTKIFFIIFCFSLCQLNHLSAFALGTGETYYSNDIPWKKIYYIDKMAKMTAAMPNTPCYRSENDWCTLYSQYGEAEYEVHFNPHLNFTAPDTLEEFLNCFNANYDEIYPVEPTNPNFIYVLEFHKTYMSDSGNFKIKQISRVYATKNQIYFFSIVGEDFSLADEFFNTLTIEYFN